MKILSVVIVAIIGVIVVLKFQGNEIVDLTTVKEAADQVTTQVEKIAEAPTEVADQVGGAAGEVIRNAADAVSQAAEDVSNAAENLETTIADATSEVTEAVSEEVVAGEQAIEEVAETQPAIEAQEITEGEPTLEESVATAENEVYEEKVSVEELYDSPEGFDIERLDTTTVSEIQKALVAEGAEIAIDGSIDEDTRDAIYDFNKRNDISENARVTSITLERLGVRL